MRKTLTNQEMKLNRWMELNKISLLDSVAFFTRRRKVGLETVPTVYRSKWALRGSTL